MAIFDNFSAWFNSNPGKVLGAAMGFLLGLLIFTLGIIKTLIIALLVLVGFFIGKSRDDGMSIIDEITGLFRRRKK